MVGGPEEAAAQLWNDIHKWYPSDVRGTEEMLVCREHGTEIDVWYDCSSCLEESQEWAGMWGYDYCVSPHIQRKGTHEGRWVTAHTGRWVTIRRPYKPMNAYLKK